MFVVTHYDGSRITISNNEFDGVTDTSASCNGTHPGPLNASVMHASRLRPCVSVATATLPPKVQTKTSRRLRPYTNTRVPVWARGGGGEGR